MNMTDVRKLAWDRKIVVRYLATIEIGTVKSTYDIADDFIIHNGVDPRSDISGVFYDIVNNMCAGFDYLIRTGDISVHRDDEGFVIVTFNKHSGLVPTH